MIGRDMRGISKVLEFFLSDLGVKVKSKKWQKEEKQKTTTIYFKVKWLENKLNVKCW